MIVMPDGKKRLPTKEEILENVRRSARESRSNSDSGGTTNNSNTTGKQDRYSSSEDRQLFNERRGTTQQYKGGTGIDESVEGSDDRTDDYIRVESGAVRGSDSSNNQYRERPATNSTTANATYFEQPPIKRSKFRPYTDAIKESFTRKKKPDDEVRQNKQRKIFSEAEVKNNREKLIEVLLWQSEHADELIIATTTGHIHTIVIWSNIDRHEAGVLADFLLRVAKRDARVAFAVREMLEIQNRLEVAIIVLPRMYKTFMTYMQYGFSIR